MELTAFIKRSNKETKNVKNIKSTDYSLTHIDLLNGKNVQTTFTCTHNHKHNSYVICNYNK